MSWKDLKKAIAKTIEESKSTEELVGALVIDLLFVLSGVYDSLSE